MYSVALIGASAAMYRSSMAATSKFQILSLSLWWAKFCACAYYREWPSDLIENYRASAMARFGVPFLGRRDTEIQHDEDTKGRGEAGSLPPPFDNRTKLVHRAPFAPADFLNAIPQLRFKPYAGTAAGNGDVTHDVHKFDALN